MLLKILLLQKRHICDGKCYLEIEEIQNTDKYKVRAHSNSDNYSSLKICARTLVNTKNILCQMAKHRKVTRNQQASQ